MREAIDTAQRQEPRIAEDGTHGALEAERRQRGPWRRSCSNVTGDRVNSDQIRSLLAAVLGGVARGLSATARVIEQTSWILRPRESARQPETVGSSRIESSPMPADARTAAESSAPADAETAVGRSAGGPAPVLGHAAEEPTPVAAPEPAAVEEPPPPAPTGPGPVPAPEAQPVEQPPVSEVQPSPEPPPTTPAPEGPDRVRTAESHIAELADRTAAELVAVIPGLSTDELGRLYEYESGHKKRKTVLRAIERAVEPASGGP